MLSDTLSALGFSEDESKTYTSLLQSGPSTAGALAKKIGAPRPSTYGFLAKLVEKGAVIESQDGKVKLFTAQRPETITGLFRNQIEELVRKRLLFERMIPDLEGMMAPHVLGPRFQSFEGKQGMQTALKDMLLYSNIETRAYWPAKAMVGMLAPAFWAQHDKQRIQNKISIKAIWPADQIIKTKTAPNNPEKKREIRTAPEGISFSLGYWIYKNKVAFFSSARECSGFIIESAELAEMMSAQHELMWQASSPLENKNTANQAA